jgi:hypothetical protein
MTRRILLLVRPTLCSGRAVRSAASGRRRSSPRWAFALALVVSLAVGVPAAFAVGWVGYVNDYDIPPGTWLGAAGHTVYSDQQRMYNNQSQLGASDPDLELVYSYDINLQNVYASACCIGYGDSNPYVWGVSAGNKYAWCGNPSGDYAGRAVSCQYYSTT